MDLKSKLKECDEKVVTNKTVVIDGKECVVHCYPKVKDCPLHYSDRNNIIKTEQINRKGRKYA